VSGDLEVTVAGERLTLLFERAAYWQSRSTLLVADLHWGKAASFRAAGVFVPRGTTPESLARLNRILQRTGASRMILLGDCFHAKEGRVPETLRVLAEWRATRPSLEIALVRGNHDRRAGDPPAELGFTCIDAPVIDSPFVLAHHPRESREGYTLAGHLHPAVRLSGRGGERARVPCFWFGASVGVLPAFGDFTGMADIAPVPGDRVFALTEAYVVEVR
jgi:uncharacterized protein